MASPARMVFERRGMAAPSTDGQLSEWFRSLGRRAQSQPGLLIDAVAHDGRRARSRTERGSMLHSPAGRGLPLVKEERGRSGSAFAGDIPDWAEHDEWHGLLDGETVATAYGTTDDSVNSVGRRTPTSPGGVLESPMILRRSASGNNMRLMSTTKDSELQSTWQTAFNTVNVFIGLGLLSTPYALSLTGWVGMAGMALGIIACLYCGTIIVRAFVKASEATNSSFLICSYASVGRIAFGAPGEVFVGTFVVLEFFGALAMTQVFLWDNAAQLLPAEWNDNLIILGCTVALLPTVWIRAFSQLSFVSFVGFAASVGTTLLVMWTLGYDGWGDGSPSAGLAPAEGVVAFTTLSKFFTGMGIVTTSLGGAPAMPVLYEQMSDRSVYTKMLCGAFLTITLVYALMGFSGYRLYGTNVNVLVTTSLNDSPGGIASKLATASVVIGTFCTVAPVTAVLSKMIEERLRITSGLGVRGVRTTVLGCAFLLGFTTHNTLGNLESFVGAFGSLFTSLLFPSMLFMKLCHAELHWWEWALNIALVLGSLALTAVVTMGNIETLKHGS